MSDTTPPPGDRSAEIDALLFDYVDRLNRGEILDPEAIEREHPDLAATLIERLEVYRSLGRPSAEPLGTLGDYTLRRQIGRGGMGIVYDAWQNSMDRPVALKVLPRAVAADTRAVTRFVREAQVAGKLHHPNIVHVYGMGIEEQVPYYAMELIDGETLAQVLARLTDAEPGAETPFGRQDSLAYFGRLAEAFAEVADGLHYAHSRKIIHRDVKPLNLILERRGTAPSAGEEVVAPSSVGTTLRILDFGLAHLEGQESLTLSGDILGTPLYMSPEQARRRKIRVDHRTDVYSLGATMYHAICGRPPFRGKDHTDTLSQIIEREAVEPRRRNPHVPRDLETIVLKCLRKDPQDRYRTAEALGQDLRRFVHGDPIEARPQGRWEQLIRRLARQKLRLLIAAGAAALLLASVLLAWRLAVETGKQRARDYERTVVAAAIKLLRGETILAGIQASPVEGISVLPGEHRAVLDASGRATVEEALSDLDRALDLLPARFEAHYHRGRALLMLGRGPEAVRELQKALQRRPGFAPALVLEAEARGAGEEPPALAGDPRGEAWSRARRALREWRFDKAAAAYGELIALEEASGELYPGSGIAHLIARGASRLYGGDFEGAMPDFWAARALSRAFWGELVEPHLLLGMAYFLRGGAGDLERAKERLEEAVSRSSSRDEGKLWAAAVYSFLLGKCTSLGRFPDAIEAGRGAVRLRPGDLRAHLALGWVLLSAIWVRERCEGGARSGEGGEDEELEELLAVARGVVELDPTSPAAHHLMGKALAARGERERARGFFERAEELQESEVLYATSDRNQGRSDMKDAEGSAAVLAASLVVALSGAGEAQEGYFEDVRPVEDVEGVVNSPFQETHPCLSEDGLELYFESTRPGGRGSYDLYVAWRSATTEPWGAVRALGGLNSPGGEQGPSLSADGLTLYFDSDGRGGAGGRDIFVARRMRRWQEDGSGNRIPVPFAGPEPLVELNTPYQDITPDISHDGLELFFSSMRPEGQGAMDLYVASRLPTDELFGEPRRLDELNTSDREWHPSISCDGRTLFFSRAASWDTLGVVMKARRESRAAGFGTPVPLGLPVNTGDLYGGGFPDVSCDWPRDGAVLLFVRAVGGGPSDVYQATWRTTGKAGVGPFLRGDCDGNGSASGNVNDAVLILRFNFVSGSARPPCLAACDANADGQVFGQVSDAIYMLSFSFRSGQAPRPPFPLCDHSMLESDVAIGCEEPHACP